MTDSYKQVWEKEMSARTTEITRLKTENARLREALEQIENDSAWNDPAWKIAHDALKGGE